MNRTLAAGFFVMLGYGCYCPPAPEPAGAPMGRLGHRIGTDLRVEGVREQSGKVGPNSFLVDKVGDVVLAAPVDLWVENVRFPVGARCVLRGYESGRWIGVPPEVERAEGLTPRQAAWQFQNFFIATAVEAPAELARAFEQDRSAK